ncbi:MAG: FKBP-type peptidyl-prolyl cis-trans isomerase [Planctomycetaceae bacterium]|nr:FKBP-type peptidyl-prolyl cis-trans isomerase [Planctomycetaceae bacterium]
MIRLLCSGMGLIVLLSGCVDGPDKQKTSPTSQQASGKKKNMKDEFALDAPGPEDADAPKKFTELPSGLKYRLLRKTDGETPAGTDKVLVNYKGWLDDKSEFDSSYKKFEPFAFSLNEVVRGWGEGLQYCPEGGMIELEIPPQLGYGKRGAGKAIPPNATLHFIVELHKILTPRPGVADKDAPKEFTELPSGLKYKLLRKADGKKPGPTSRVVVHYKGWLDNGKVFDSSYTRGETTQFGLDEVVKGWGEGLQYCPAGGMIELEIPPELGYGARGAGGDIPPNSTLHFIVEIEKVL